MLELVLKNPLVIGIINKTTTSLDVVSDNASSFNNLNYIIIFLFIIIIIFLGNLMFSKE